MAGTRSSAKAASPHKADSAAGTKRKAETASPKRAPKAAKQTTIEETLGGDEIKDASKTKDASEVKNESEAKADESNDVSTNTEVKSAEPEDIEMPDQTGEEQSKASDQPEDNPAEADTENTIQESSQREKNCPSSILEKGIIYFFTRNRVGIDEAESVGDLQRTFFVLRPLPANAKIGDGALPDSKNNRLFALPKKVFPKSHNDRFMTFVQKEPSTVEELKNDFMKGSSYETKTAGTRQVDPVTTAAEGVYAITRTEDRSTHLVYAITIPSELGEVQEDLGLRPQGSFVFSVKNPTRSGPANSTLPQGPDFPKE
jgi:hypothetical protein